MTDKVLGKHYGFTEEELGFITNYDIENTVWAKDCNATFMSYSRVLPYPKPRHECRDTIGFTEEELDFISNYDIKYRMGKGLQE